MTDRFPELTDELLARHDVAGPRYTSYPTVPEWSRDFGAEDHVRALTLAGQVDAPLSLYVHIPFCREMCTYCGCNMIASRDPARADRYLEAVSAEAALAAQHLGRRRAVTRLHLGGGTPTSLDERQLETLWRALVGPFSVAPGAELAVEIDPVVTRPSQLALLAGFGFRRLSMGVQDFDPGVQAAVARVQTVAETRALLEEARRLGFASVNLDLIYGLPRQTLESWRRTLAEVVALRPDRVAAFSFAYVPTVRANQRKLVAAELPTGRAKLELFRLTHDTLVDAGYQAIGLDHFALPADELAQARARRALWRDFQGYTVLRGASRDTVALGVTGISCLGGAFAQTVKPLPAYQEAVAAGRFATERGHWLSADDLRRRDLITGLMCNGWIDLGADAETAFARELAALRPLAADGLLTLTGSEVTLTPLGRVLVRVVAMVFDSYLARHVGGDRPVFSRTI